MKIVYSINRCVDDKIRSFALGIQWIVVRIFGTIPAPIIFGRLIDESCILWQQESCGNEGGACILYDNKNMAKYMLFLALTGKALSVLFFFLSSFYYIPPKVHCQTEEDLTPAEKYIKKELEKY
jgi:organic anion transporter 4A